MQSILRFGYYNLRCPLSRKGTIERFNTTSGAIYLYIGYTMSAAIGCSQAHQGSIWWVLWFMWFTKKRIYKQIQDYGQDQEILIKLANFCLCEDASDLKLEDVKAFYTRYLDPIGSIYIRNKKMKEIRKFFRYLNSRGDYCLPARCIKDNPFDCVDSNATIPKMKKEVKRKPGRPIDWETIKKIVILKDDCKLSFSQIGKVAKPGQIIDKSQAYRQYQRGKAPGVDLSTV